jgi:hypothetical protein
MAMSEFKFACPVCGQHITADSSATGSQLDCPTCFRKIVVPQAPSSAESKFVLSASEANKPRPASSLSASSSEARPMVTSGRSIPILLVVGLLVAASAGASLFLFGGKIFKGDQRNAPSIKTNPAPAKAAEVVIPPSTNQLPWTLDLTNTPFPENSVNGRIHDRDFISERAVLQGGTLSFRMKPNHPLDMSINIYLFAKQAEELSGKSAIVTTNNIRSPRVTLRWKENDKNVTRPFTNGYALKLEFGAQNGNRMPGKVYICLPDDEHSSIAGVFDAEIKKPAPPKPKPAKTN